MENGSLQNELKKLESTVDDIKEQLSEVHSAIVGNPLTRDGGLAQRVIEIEEKVAEFENRLELAEKKQIKYNIYTVVMWTSLGGVAMSIFLYVAQLIIKR